MSISEEELSAAADQLFDQLDVNKNGKLEKNEVRVFVDSLFKQVCPGGSMNEAKFEETFNKLDKNSDGSVSREELYASLVEKAKLSGQLS